MKLATLYVNEEQLVDNKQLREILKYRVDILDKVKDLLLIPDTTVATTQQVADFYEVDLQTIKMLILRHKDELKEDGFALISYQDFLKVQHVSFKIEQGKSVMSFVNGTEMTVPRRGLRVFHRRAILRVGMLLRDSQVAREVRTQLLNIENTSSKQKKTEDIRLEKGIYEEIEKARQSKDFDAFDKAMTDLDAFKNSHINILEISNDILTDGILNWSERANLNFYVRKLGKITNEKYESLWRQLYRELLYKYHINLKARGFSPYIQHIRENEWSLVIKSFGAICEDKGISCATIMRKS